MKIKEELIPFARRLKEARENAGLNKTEFAEKLNTSKSAVSAYENAVNDPSVTLVSKMAEILGADIAWLVTGKINKDKEITVEQLSLINEIKHMNPENTEKVKKVIDLLK